MSDFKVMNHIALVNELYNSEFILFRKSKKKFIPINDIFF